MEKCTYCGRETKQLLTTAYGEELCEDCWDDYICTKRGQVEYLIGICRGDYPASEFDADFLGSVAVSWMLCQHKFKLPASEILEIEAKAESLGLLD
jgi:hypothetical protein